MEMENRPPLFTIDKGALRMIPEEERGTPVVYEGKDVYSVGKTMVSDATEEDVCFRGGAPTRGTQPLIVYPGGRLRLESSWEAIERDRTLLEGAVEVVAVHPVKQIYGSPGRVVKHSN